MRPEQRLAVDILLEQALAHHQAQVLARATPGRVGGLVDDVAQVVETAGQRGPPFRQPFLARLAALPCAGGEAQNLHLHTAAFQRAGENIRRDGRNRDRPSAHRPRSEEHTSELQSLMRISYAVFCLKQKTYLY